LSAPLLYIVDGLVAGSCCTWFGRGCARSSTLVLWIRRHSAFTIIILRAAGQHGAASTTPTYATHPHASPATPPRTVTTYMLSLGACCSCCLISSAFQVARAQQPILIENRQPRVCYAAADCHAIPFISGTSRSPAPPGGSPHRTVSGCISPLWTFVIAHDAAKSSHACGVAVDGDGVHSVGTPACAGAFIPWRTGRFVGKNSCYFSGVNFHRYRIAFAPLAHSPPHHHLLPLAWSQFVRLSHGIISIRHAVFHWLPAFAVTPVPCCLAYGYCLAAG